MEKWYCCTAAEVLDGLGVAGEAAEGAEKRSARRTGPGSAGADRERFCRRGLSAEQVRSRRERYGENRLRESGRKPDANRPGKYLRSSFRIFW